MEYLGVRTSTSNLSSYSFGSSPFGSADPNRDIVLGIASRGSSGIDISSVQIGGIEATFFTRTNTTAAGVQVTGIAHAPVPLDESGTISINFNSTAIRCYVAIYRVVGRTIFDSGTRNVINTSGSVSLTGVNVPEGGGGIVVLNGVNWTTPDSDAWTATGITMRDSRNLELNRPGTAFDLYPSGTTDATWTFSPTGSHSSDKTLAYVIYSAPSLGQSTAIGLGVPGQDPPNYAF